MVAAMIQHNPSATAPARMAAATLCSWTISFHRSNGAIRTTMANEITKTTTPSAAKMRALRTAISVIRNPYSTGIWHGEQALLEWIGILRPGGVGLAVGRQPSKL